MVCFWCPLGKNGGVDGPLVDSCLEYALDLEGDGSTLDMRAGIWGGSGPQDRANLDKGLMTAEDLFGMCAYEDCDEPIPKAGNKRLYCSWKCGYLARRAEKAA